MQVSFLKRSSAFALLLAGAACAGNNSSDTEVGAARDTSTERFSDSAQANQTESGMTDSSGQSTLGPDAEKIRPDQGQPVTAKGDTISSTVDSSYTTSSVDSSTISPSVDSATINSGVDSSTTSPSVDSSTTSR